MADNNKKAYYNPASWRLIVEEELRRREREDFLKSYEGLTIEEKVDKLIRDFADFRYSMR